MRIVEPSVQLLWSTHAPTLQVELAARTCYKSEDKLGTTDLVSRLISSGHHAMIEHASASIKIVTDRGITHEIVRHRIASYAQESTRYCNYSQDKFGREVAFIQPPGLDDRQHGQWQSACLDAERYYFQMLDMGCSPQIARSVLPNCTKTEIVMTCNFREWRHFILLRSSKAAHPQIRPIAAAVWKVLYELAPELMIDITPIPYKPCKII